MPVVTIGLVIEARRKIESGLGRDERAEAPIASQRSVSSRFATATTADGKCPSSTDGRTTDQSASYARETTSGERLTITLPAAVEVLSVFDEETRRLNISGHDLEPAGNPARYLTAEIKPN